MENTLVESPIIVSQKQLFDHWQGHRNLTRRVIEKFPEDKLFTYSIGGMRPFAELAMEMIKMAAPSLRGVVAGKWPTPEEVDQDYGAAKTKQELLALWDKGTREMEELWDKVPLERFQQMDNFWDQYPGVFYTSILYLIDNEVHHRAQGYVYLRSLGIEPPFFWERA